MDKEKQNENIPNMSKEERKQAMRVFGLVAGLLSKVILEASGCEVNFKINGEDIGDIEKMHSLDISERLELAVKEQRFEDAAKLKKLLDSNKP